MIKAFDYNALFIKAKIYVERAFEEERDSELYPFWLSLSLEFVIRSTLAKIHPALLADTPNPNEFKSLLYAFGFDKGEPKSIQITTAINRLGEIIPEFTQEEKNKAGLIINERNKELHSAIKGFIDYPVDSWIKYYYRICHILLKHQGLTLKDLFVEEEANAALVMIEEGDATIKKTVNERIQAYKKVYTDLSSIEMKERVENSEKELRKFGAHTKKEKCPCCGNFALLTGEKVSVSSAKLIDSELKVEVRYLPLKLACFACGLKLDSYQQLNIVNLGAIFTKLEQIDAVEYLGIEPEDYIDIDEIVERRMKEYDYGMEYMDE